MPFSSAALTSFRIFLTWGPVASVTYAWDNALHMQYGSTVDLYDAVYTVTVSLRSMDRARPRQAPDPEPQHVLRVPDPVRVRREDHCARAAPESGGAPPPTDGRVHGGARSTPTRMPMTECSTATAQIQRYAESTRLVMPSSSPGRGRRVPSRLGPL